MLNITNTLPKQPAAKIIMDGLLILCINQETQRAELGVYEYANEHELFIRISKKEQDVATFPSRGGQLIRRLDDQDEIKTGNIRIARSQPGGQLSTYQHPSLSAEAIWSDPRDIGSDLEQNSQEYVSDFRWIIDLEGGRFHHKKLEVVPGVIHRKISLPSGVLYTEDWARRKVHNAYKNAATLANCASENRYYYVSNQLGLAVESLGESETLDIHYGNASAPQTLKLPKPNAGIYYEIFISNNCNVKDAEKKNRQSDFQNYYNVLNVPVAERLELGTIGGMGTQRFPCDLIYLGETPELP